MLEKIRAYIKENRMLKRKDRIVVGVSGGADSVCLFFVLLELQKEYGLVLEVVHINHGIRGREAWEDEAFVQRMAEENKIGFRSFHADIPAVAKEKGIGEEEAGRIYRYGAMEAVRKELSADKIAVAHNENDCAETVLLNLFRGAYLTGLSGIAPVRGRVIRPLLCVSRKEIEDWLLKRQISYRTDKTNFSDDYTRNRIRLHLFPMAEKEINPRAVEHTAKTSFFLREVADYMEKQIKASFQKNVSEENGVYFLWNGLFEEDIVLIRGVIKLVLEKLSERKRDLESCHVEMVQQLFFRQTGRQIHLPYKMTARRSYEGIELFRREEAETKNVCPGEEEYILRVPGEYELPGGKRIILRILEAEKKNREIPKNNCTKWFDYDKIKNSLSLRHRRTGDYIQIGENGGKKKLKDELIDCKIPRQARDELWLLAEGSHILWILERRNSEAYRITKETVRILEVKLYKSTSLA